MRISLDGAACVLATLLLLTLPLPWLLAAVATAAFHESCHFIALFLAGVRPLGLRIGIGGAEMETPPLTAGSELLCAAAGPLGSLFLLLFLRRIPRIALCAGIQGLFNLLPIFPLDGGRILHSVSVLLLPRQAERITACIEGTTLAGILIFTLILCFRFSLGLVPFLAAAMLALKALLRKIPCKEAKLGVQ